MSPLKSQPTSASGATAKAQTKPVIDAVIDCVAALSGVARSIRARARHPVKKTRVGVRKARRGAVRTGRRIAREVKDAAKGKGEKFEKSLDDFGRRAHAAAGAFRAAVHSPSKNGVRSRAS